MFKKLLKLKEKLYTKCPWTDKGLRTELDELARLLDQVVDQRESMLVSMGFLEHRYQELYATSRDYLSALALLSNGEVTISADALLAVRQGKAGVNFEQNPDGSVLLKLTQGDDVE